jgi:predicted enzyme related to lactoylglutathione lyase
MPGASKPGPGQVGWIDLTVPNAEAVHDFHQQVTGWTASAVDMGGYADSCMSSAAGRMVAGICHARGVNAELPAVWMG